MRLAVSNIALPAFDHVEQFYALAELGLTGVEIAPSRAWEQTWHGLSAEQVSTYRKAIEAAGLKVVGLHSLFFDRPELGLFKDPQLRASSLEFYHPSVGGLSRPRRQNTRLGGGVNEAKFQRTKHTRKQSISWPNFVRGYQIMAPCSASSLWDQIAPIS